MTDLQIQWAVWCVCAFIGCASAVYALFEHVTERRRAKRARAELDARWERFFNHVAVLSGPEKAAEYRMRSGRELLG